MITCEFENSKKANLRHACASVVLLNPEKDSILLARRAQGLLGAGKWCIPGGYMEMNQRVLGTAKAEVLEETGRDITFLGIVGVTDLPERGDNGRQNVVFVFAAVAGEKCADTDGESTEQAWFKFNNLPPKEEWAFDHYTLVQHYSAHGVLPLPLEQFFIGIKVNPAS
jgi:8-oxo-dGTP diphosphatase